VKKIKNINPRRKKFLILIGASLVGFLVSVLLHNFLYGLSVISQHIFLLSRLAEILHAFFFLVAIFVCPIAFIVGVIGSIAFSKKPTR